jgi:hypothetical protein
MITYPSIAGLSHVPFGEPCLAFHKYDGSNLRFFWDRACGWHRCGTRYRWFDANNPGFGSAVCAAGPASRKTCDNNSKRTRASRTYKTPTRATPQTKRISDSANSFSRGPPNRASWAWQQFGEERDVWERPR